MASSEEGTKIAFWVVVSIAILVIVISVILIIIGSVLYTTYKGAIDGAFFNQNTCATFPMRCNYFNINPPIPTEFPEAFSQTIAIFCGQQVLSLEYFSQTHDLHIPPGLMLLGTVRTAEKDAPIFAYVALDKANRVMYIIIRGTITAEEWGFDFKFAQNMLTGQQSLKTFARVNWNCNGDPLVHTGFYELFWQIQPRIQQLVMGSITCADRVVISGHSLGAAISSLTAVYVSSNLTKKPIFVYTFGEPRVGNESYARCITEHFPNRFWRISNSEDIVPQVPISATPNLSNFNQPWLYSAEGQQIGFSTNWGSMQLNHSMQNYIESILVK